MTYTLSVLSVVLRHDDRNDLGRGVDLGPCHDRSDGWADRKRIERSFETAPFALITRVQNCLSFFQRLMYRGRDGQK